MTGFVTNDYIYHHERANVSDTLTHYLAVPWQRQRWRLFWNLSVFFVEPTLRVPTSSQVNRSCRYHVHKVARMWAARREASIYNSLTVLSTATSGWSFTCHGATFPKPMCASQPMGPSSVYTMFWPQIQIFPTQQMARFGAL